MVYVGLHNIASGTILHLVQYCMWCIATHTHTFALCAVCFRLGCMRCSSGSKLGLVAAQISNVGSWPRHMWWRAHLQHNICELKLGCAWHEASWGWEPCLRCQCDMLLAAFPACLQPWQHPCLQPWQHPCMLQPGVFADSSL